ncbi:MAG: TetR/AcrR family transcriptional regulator [Gemmatimonadales bacterium]
MTPTTDAAVWAAAEQLYAREGLKALTMRRVADQVGISPMAIYHHFPGKDALVDAVAGAGFGRLGASMAGAGNPARPPIERIRLILRRYLDFAEAEPAVFALMFSRKNPGGVRFPEYFAEGKSPTFDLLRAAVTEGMRLGTFERGDPAEVSLAFWSLVHGLVVLRATGHLPTGKVLRGIMDRSVDRLLAGLAVPTRPSRSARR